METATETNQNNRELTATEIKITLAQIEDRLIRVLKALDDYRFEMENQKNPLRLEFDEKYGRDESKWPMGASEELYLINREFDRRLDSEARAKHSIPYGVCLFDGESINNDDIAPFMQFAKWWVKGEMDDDCFELFTYHFCEIVEVDFFWVLMDQPGFYYSQDWPERGDLPTFVELEPELRQIGTRSKKKARINFTLNIGHGWNK